MEIQLQFLHIRENISEVLFSSSNYCRHFGNFNLLICPIKIFALIKLIGLTSVNLQIALQFWYHVLDSIIFHFQWVFDLREDPHFFFALIFLILQKTG